MAGIRPRKCQQNSMCRIYNYFPMHFLGRLEKVIPAKRGLIQNISSASASNLFLLHAKKPAVFDHFTLPRGASPYRAFGLAAPVA